MINCKKCNFIVNGNLSFAIRQNFCPSCGSSLLDNNELKSISFITNKLVINNIASKLDDSEVFMLSLFIMENFIKNENSPSVEKEASLEENAEFDVIENIEDIRDEVKKEVLSSSQAEDYGEDIDQKVQRLKRVHKSSPTLKKTGASVKRLSGA
tara:strand:- start:19 stop:480 length:462 start_codon:yes stop_codon:yes gene_type:complete